MMLLPSTPIFSLQILISLLKAVVIVGDRLRARKAKLLLGNRHSITFHLHSTACRVDIHKLLIVFVFFILFLLIVRIIKMLIFIPGVLLATIFNLIVIIFLFFKFFAVIWR